MFISSKPLFYCVSRESGLSILFRSIAEYGVVRAEYSDLHNCKLRLHADANNMQHFNLKMRAVLTIMQSNLLIMRAE